MDEQWWIVVCDRARARVWAASTLAGEWRELEDWVNPAARSPQRALTSDRPGRSFDRVGGGRHGMSPPLELHDKLRDAFAVRIAHRIEAARRSGACQRLAIVAPDEFLGALRAALPLACRSLRPIELALDLVAHDRRGIARRLMQARAVSA